MQSYIVFLLISILHNIQTYGETCCFQYPTEVTCNELGERCVWMDDPFDFEDISIQCVSQQFIDCSSSIEECEAFDLSECVFVDCDTNEVEYNIQFILDVSGSVGYSNHQTNEDFIKNMIENEVNQVSKVSLLYFATQCQIHYSFNDPQNDRRAGILQIIDNEAHYTRGGTYTKKAIKKGLSDFNAADITDQENNILILMTDGRPYPSSQVPCALKPLLDALNIEVIIIGIGRAFREQYIDCLVDNPNDDIILMDDFDVSEFQITEYQISQRICPIVTTNFSLNAIDYLNLTAEFKGRRLIDVVSFMEQDKIMS